jgi:uncharacterized protein DUF2784
MIAAQTFYRLLADLVVLLHFGFVLFVILGGFLVARQRRVMWFHLATVFWGAFIEFAGWICPLTPLENRLRAKSGTDGYDSDFVAHYIIPILYPEGLTRETQIALGAVVIMINLGIYGWILRRKAGRNVH